MDGEAVLLGMSFLKHVEMVQKNKQLTLRLKSGYEIDPKTRY